MPDIRIKSTGKIYYQVDALLCAILGDLHPENIERVQSPAAVQAQNQPAIPPKIPTWSCGIGHHSGAAVFLRLPSGETIESHEHPDLLDKSFGVFREEKLYVPKDVVAEYRRRWQQDRAPVR